MNAGPAGKPLLETSRVPLSVDRVAVLVFWAGKRWTTFTGEGLDAIMRTPWTAHHRVGQGVESCESIPKVAIVTGQRF
jgi:hypothetical protein